jgi:hypothetical protein
MGNLRERSTISCMTSERRPRFIPRRVIVAALVITNVLAAIAVVVVAMKVFGGLGGESAGLDASGTPTASATAVQPTPSASTEPSPEPTPQPGRPDTIALVTVNELNLRAEPAASAKSFGHLSVGDRVFILQGPEPAGGYGWFQVAIVDQTTVAGTVDATCGDTCLTARVGWVAGITDRQEAWLVPAQLTCPPDPDLDTFAGLEPFERLACYGDRTLTLNGVVWQPCCGWVGPFLYEPDWLSWPSYGVYLQPVGEALHSGGFGIRLNPAAGLAFPAYADIIRVTGHMDDPAADGCTIKVDEGALLSDPTVAVDPEDLAYAPIGCRTEFVVESMEVLGNTGETCGC